MLLSVMVSRIDWNLFTGNYRHFPPPGGDAYGETQEGSELEMVKVTITFDRKVVRVTITIRRAANSCN